MMGNVSFLENSLFLFLSLFVVSHHHHHPNSEEIDLIGTLRSAISLSISSPMVT